METEFSDTEFNDDVPDGSEQLDQLQSSETLVARGVDDVLDEGIVAPEHWSPAQGFGNTLAEMRQGETLEQRIPQEEPEVVPDDSDWNPTKEKRQVGSQRAGRLVDSTHGLGGSKAEGTETIAEDVGFAGGAASAEEAAMHIIDEEDLDEDQQSDGEDQ